MLRCRPPATSRCPRNVAQAAGPTSTPTPTHPETRVSLWDSNGVGGSRLRIYVDASRRHGHEVPQAFGDVPTEVIETPGFAIRAGPRPPVNCGVSIGLPQLDTGTLGCLVHDGDGCRYLLSNNHVLAANSRGAIGDPIVHPGPHDGGTSPADDIATLARFVPIDFGTGPNHVDGGPSGFDSRRLAHGTGHGPCRGETIARTRTSRHSWIRWRWRGKRHHSPLCVSTDDPGRKTLPFPVREQLLGLCRFRGAI